MAENLAWHGMRSPLKASNSVTPTPTGCNLKNINLTLERGRSYALVGASGAGKSTLLDILLGLLIPTGGVVRLDEKPLTRWHAQCVALGHWLRAPGSVHH